LNLPGLDQRQATEVEGVVCGQRQRFARGTSRSSAKLEAAKAEVFQELQGVFSEASSSLDGILQRRGNQKVVDRGLGSIDVQLPSSQVCLSASSGQRSTAATESEEHAHPLNSYVMAAAKLNYSRDEAKQALYAEMQQAVRAVVHNALQGLRRSEEELIVQRTKELLTTTRTSLGKLQADFAERFELVGVTLTRQIEAFFEQRLEHGQIKKQLVVPGIVAPVVAHRQVVPTVHDLATPPGSPPSSPRSSDPSSTSSSLIGEPLHIVRPVFEASKRHCPPACVPRLVLPPPIYEPYAGRCYMEREPPLPPLLVTGRTKDPNVLQAGISAGRSSLSGSAGSRRPTPSSSWQRALRRARI